MPLNAGASTRVINCRRGDDIAGQLHRRICEHVRDNLEANCLYLTDGTLRLLLINLDLAGLWEPETARALREAVAEAADLPPRHVLISSTHTHTGPDTLGLLHDSPRNDRYLGELRAWLCDAAQEAVAAARPVRAGVGLGAAHVGFNRRLCWADGTHSMYGNSAREDFTGLEGPDDPRHAALCLRDEQDAVVAIVHNNCCHTTCVEQGNFASADFPGEARRLIREAFNAPLPVLYLQGASGDTSPWDMIGRNRPDREVRLRQVGAAVAAETMRLVNVMRTDADAALAHAFEDVQVAVRMPSEDELRRAAELKAAGCTQENRRDYILLVDGALRLYEAFRDSPVDTLAVHAVRVGDLVIVTNPCELYCQFGIDMKRRSPAPVTMVAQLTDGFSGYCPTMAGALGGGYSSDPTYWTRLDATTGYRLVDTAARLAHTLGFPR